MNLNETEKINLSANNNPENLSKNGPLTNTSPVSVEEKVRTDKENISIKAPEPLNIRELFQDKAEKEKQIKVNYREKQINEATVKNIKEAEIKISKSTDEVIKLIKQSKADLPRVANKIPVQKDKPSEEIIKKDKPNPRLNKIIQEEISKLKEEQKKPIDQLPKQANEPATIKFTRPKQTETQAAQPKSKVEPTIDYKSGDNKSNKTTAESLETVNNKSINPKLDLSDKTTPSVVKISPEPLAKKPEQHLKKAVESNLAKQLDETENKKRDSVAPKKGIVELSSLTPEEKRAFFKEQKEKDQNNHKKIFKIVIPAAAATLIVSVSLFFVFSSNNDQVSKRDLLAQTKSETTGVILNQAQQQNTSAVTDMQSKIEQKVSNPKLNTQELSLPPLPEIQGLNEPIVNLLKEDNPTQEVVEDLGSEDKTSVAPPKENKIEEEEPPFFVAVEQMPEPIGGLADIQKRVIYPSVALQTGIEGKVYVRALVNEAGIVTETEILKGIGAGCDEAAADAVAKTKFKPGIQRGRPVKVQITIPIVFKKGQ